MQGQASHGFGGANQFLIVLQMANVAISPGGESRCSTRQAVPSNTDLADLDPLFYMHHAYLDKLFWKWQQADPARLSEVGGQNVQTGTTANSAFTRYNGDNGTITTVRTSGTSLLIYHSPHVHSRRTIFACIEALLTPFLVGLIR